MRIPSFGHAEAAAFVCDPTDFTEPVTIYRPLSRTAASVLAALPRPDDNPWVIAGRKPGADLTVLQHPWRRIRAWTGLDDVRIHDLRYSLASRALALGESLPMIGKLLGHTHVQTTARYAHLARDSVKTSESKIADSIGADILADSNQDAEALIARFHAMEDKGLGRQSRGLSS